MARTSLTRAQTHDPRQLVTKTTEHDARLDSLMINESTGFATRTGAGAVPITHRNCKIVTTGAEALTIAAGALDQEIILTMVTDGGDGTLTGTFNPALTSIVFNDIRDWVYLKMDATGWVVVANGGCTIT